MRLITKKFASSPAEIVDKDSDALISSIIPIISSIIPQDIGLQYLKFNFTNIYKRAVNTWITVNLKITVTTAAVFLSKWIAETEVAAPINSRTIIPIIRET